MLDDLITHFKNSNNNSLLARIYGMYTINTNVFEPLDIIIMQNTKYQSERKSAELTFDIKGSTHKRLTKGIHPNEYKRWLNGKSSNKIMKDLNFLKLQKDSNQDLIRIDDYDQTALRDQIVKDSLFLCHHNLIDYSLLLTIEKKKIKH